VLTLFPQSRSKRSFRVTRLTQLGHAAVVAGLLLGISAEAQAMAAPSLQIATLSTSGMAPFTVHFHALNSWLGGGTPIDAHYRWDFGDPGSDYNTIDGWNAAHTYDEPGTYVVTLTVTNQFNETATSTTTITVSDDTRQTLYVSADGNDNNNGLSPSSPIKTYAHALDTVQNNMNIAFRRGDTFNVSGGENLTKSNVVVTAYGSGNRPVLRWNGPLGFSCILGIDDVPGHNNVIIEDLVFDSIYAASYDRDIVDATCPGGENVTIRNCHFGNVSLATNGNRVPQGVLIQDNTAQVIGAYFAWVQGTDITIIGNECDGSVFEHNIRLGGADRVNIAKNSMTNDGKRTIWAMEGEYCYISENELFDGRLTVGPNPASGSASVRLEWAVVERNMMDRHAGGNANYEVFAGAEHLMIKNNVIKSDGGTCISIAEYDPNMNRKALDIRIINNTGICQSTQGRFLATKSGSNPILVANNLYAAPNMETGAYQTASVFVEANSLSDFSAIQNNVWALPADYLWIDDAVNYQWPYWAHASGYKTPGQWESASQVVDDAYETTYLAWDFKPEEASEAAVHAEPHEGIFNDFYGETRPLSGAWTVGAVEMASGGTASPPDDVDLNGDGSINATDLALLLSCWGDDCADLNGDGVVGPADLALLLGAWSEGNIWPGG
jgi:PKD repeat protein